MSKQRGPESSCNLVTLFNISCIMSYCFYVLESENAENFFFIHTMADLKWRACLSLEFSNHTASISAVFPLNCWASRLILYIRRHCLWEKAIFMNKRAIVLLFSVFEYFAHTMAGSILRVGKARSTRAKAASFGELHWRSSYSGGKHVIWDELLVRLLEEHSPSRIASKAPATMEAG